VVRNNHRVFYCQKMISFALTKVLTAMEKYMIKDGKFEYIEKGEGKPIVLLHGLFGALSNFESVLDEFSKKYKIIIPLLPIYSLSIEDTNVKCLADFLHEFLDHKKLEKVTLLGNSLGGHVGLVYCKSHLDRVEAMILTGSSGLYENAMGGSFPRREDFDFIKNKVAETFYDPKHATEELVQECYQIVNDRGRLIRILALAKSAVRHNMGSEISDFNIPVCLIWGKNDTITPPDVAEEFHRLLPNSELNWIDKCAHAPMMEQPEEFNRILAPWLEKTLG
jgi:2-hydroxy-6-oxonona-2,4-dienedioate hydrolase